LILAIVAVLARIILGASGRLMSVLDPKLPQWWTERIQASWDRAHPLAVRDHRR
jgi:hypothetical protein